METSKTPGSHDLKCGFTGNLKMLTKINLDVLIWEESVPKNWIMQKNNYERHNQNRNDTSFSLLFLQNINPDVFFSLISTNNSFASKWQLLEFITIFNKGNNLADIVGMFNGNHFSWSWSEIREREAVGTDWRASQLSISQAASLVCAKYFNSIWISVSVCA